jgi:hypothetical protein
VGLSDSLLNKMADGDRDAKKRENGMDAKEEVINMHEEVPDLAYECFPPNYVREKLPGWMWGSLRKQPNM